MSAGPQPERKNRGHRVRKRQSGRPAMVIDSDGRQAQWLSLTVRDLPPDLIIALGSCSQEVLQSVLRVSLLGSGRSAAESLPSLFGRHQVLNDGLRFFPYFPFEAGVRLRATFDPAAIGREVAAPALVRELTVPQETRAERPYVQQVFPSADLLPENLLRFYACFSHPMQRGGAVEHIAIVGPDGRAAEDVLYRAPVELWDRSMRCLTILLDPGRLKRGVGPNRALGPPLKAGADYALVIDAGMVAASGQRLSNGLRKRFQVTDPLRKPIIPQLWRVLAPAASSRQPLEILFPQPLDWAQLWHAITVISENGQPTVGRIAIDQSERRWSFKPTSSWNAGCYHVHVAADLEDVCGNNLMGAFDRPLRSPDALRDHIGSGQIAFSVRPGRNP
jgi:hypothetical protein